MGFFVVKFVKPLNVLLYASSIAVRLESICCIQEEVGEWKIIRLLDD